MINYVSSQCYIDKLKPCPSPGDQVGPCHCYVSPAHDQLGIITCNKYKYSDGIKVSFVIKQALSQMTRIKEGFEIDQVYLYLPKGTSELDVVPNIFITRYPLAEVLIEYPKKAPLPFLD